ncbi:TPA: fimbrial-like protein [Escherichia coli]
MQMKSLHYGIFASITLSLLLFSTFSIAITDSIGLNVMTTVENRTCQSEISNQGLVNLGTVGVGYFASNVSAEDNYPGGKTFTVTVKDCPSAGTTSSQLHIEFKPVSGVMATGSQQIFANNHVGGAQNVGIVIFSQNNQSSDTVNVLSPTGQFRTVWPVASANMNNSSWQFYTRMQKIDPLLPVGAGFVTSNVLVDIYYQ